MIKNCSVNILGSKYTIKLGTADVYPMLDDCGGYTDTSCKLIIIQDINVFEKGKDTKLNLREVQDTYLRHEIIHAFLYESGLACNSSESDCWAENEEMVDWFAIQYPKIKKVYDKLGI